MTHKRHQYVVDVRDHLARALHGHARQPRRDDGAARDPQRTCTPALSGLEWTVNAYTLTFAVLLLTGAALGDRFGRRRMFAIGITIFTARLGGRGARAVDRRRSTPRARCRGSAARSSLPLTLTILSAAVPAGAPRPRARRVGRHQRPRRRARPARRRRGRRRHLLALDLLAERADRHRAARRSRCRGCRSRTARRRGSTCRASRSRAPACSGSSGGSCAATPSAGPRPRSSARSSAASRARALFVSWELRHRAADAADALLPRTARSRSRTSRRSSCSSGCSARSSCSRSSSRRCRATRRCSSGLRILPWTAMPIFVAPIAGALSDRIGGAPLMGAGLALQAAGLALDRRGLDADDAVRRRSCSRSRSPASGMGAVLRARSPTSSSPSVTAEEEGQASGANNAIRELGGVFGVAVLASVFAHYGGYRSGAAFVDGMSPAVYVGAVIVALGSAWPRSRSTAPARTCPLEASSRSMPRPGGGRVGSRPECQLDDFDRAAALTFRPVAGAPAPTSPLTGTSSGAQSRSCATARGLRLRRSPYGGNEFASSSTSPPTSLTSRGCDRLVTIRRAAGPQPRQFARPSPPDSASAHCHDEADAHCDRDSLPARRQRRQQHNRAVVAGPSVSRSAGRDHKGRALRSDGDQSVAERRAMRRASLPAGSRAVHDGRVETRHARPQHEDAGHPAHVNRGARPAASRHAAG